MVKEETLQFRLDCLEQTMKELLSDWSLWTGNRHREDCSLADWH